MPGKIRVQPTSREVIWGKLLAALYDADKVGIVLSQADLAELIKILETTRTSTAPQRLWLADLRKLQKAAFGEK